MSIVVRGKEHPTGLRKMVGYYGHQRRYPGEEFEIQNKSEMGRWMEEVKPKGNSVSVGIDLKNKKE